MGNLPGTCARSLFYPDWEGDNEGCINDGNEPAYMTDNALNYMFSLVVDCCKEHYQWNYHACTLAASTLNRDMYFPDWDSTDNVCKTGGGQPPYMNNSPDIWMHDTLAECCSANYAWNYATCIGSAPTPTATTPAATTPTATTPSATPALYYPDWLSNDYGCSNDNGQPSYMTNSPSFWMHSTLEACCNKNYSWNYDACMGTASSGTPTPGTNKYYLSWTADTCVQDCNGASPCGGRADSWDPLYSTLKTCCQEANWWNDDCKS